MHTLTRLIPIDVFVFASPVYWADPAETHAFFERLKRELPQALGCPDEGLQLHLIYSDVDLAAAKPASKFGCCAFMPLSGGVQPWMLQLSAHCDHIVLINGYLPDAQLDFALTDNIMHRNGHPACTDLYAHLRKTGRSVIWLRSLARFLPIFQAWQASQRLRQAKLLKIGETEPWVINSCRDPQRFLEKFGTQIIPLEAQKLYETVSAVTEAEARELAHSWLGGASATDSLLEADINKACRVIVAMERHLKEHQADGLSMACFAMIGILDTTSCLALSYLNDSAHRIGACEGDLDAAVTLFLLKALGADFVWIANPIIYDAPYIDMAHCTAPRCGCSQTFSYKLTRHHESGRGVAPEVKLPGDQSVTLARIGGNLEHLALFPGKTERIDKMHTCHTQIRVHLESTDALLDNLHGTHLVMAYGDYSEALQHCARFLDLQVNAGV